MTQCHNCGAERDRIAQHWSMSSTCEAPELTEKQKEIINGLMLGDGSVVRPTANPRLQVNSRKESFLEFIHGEFGVFSATRPRLVKSAEELAQADRESGFHPEAEAENYGNKYGWESICSKRFEPWREWYETGKKVWPNDIDLTPLTMSVWYASDASFNPNHGKGRAKIDTANEKDSREKVLSYFNGISVETPAWDSYEDHSRIRFSAEGTQQLLEYMDTVIPGYEHKWMNNE